MVSRVLVLGAKQHAQVMCDILQMTGNEVFGFLDDDLEIIGSTLMGLPVLGTTKELQSVAKTYGASAAMLGISARHHKVRARLQKAMEGFGLLVINAMHPTAYISNRAKIGNGNMFAPFSTINSFTEIGSNCVFYSGTVVDHHSLLGDNVYCGPNVSIAADSSVGDNTYIGVGASLIPHVNIGKNVIVGAGSAIIHDIPDNAVVVGVPGKVIKYSE